MKIEDSEWKPIDTAPTGQIVRLGKGLVHGQAGVERNGWDAILTRNVRPQEHVLRRRVQPLGASTSCTAPHCNR